MPNTPGTITQPRLTLERRAEIARLKQPSPAHVRELVAELDAVTRERDDFRAELSKLGAEVDSLTRERDEGSRIACGSTDPDPDVEQLLVEMRENINAPKGFDGCGGRGVWRVMYRCVECGRWMHRDCILKHFESHKATSDSAASNEERKPEEVKP